MPRFLVHELGLGQGRQLTEAAQQQLAGYSWPGNLREMEWVELDLDAALWTIPSAKMKRTKKDKEHGLPHVVPLPVQAVALLLLVAAMWWRTANGG